MQELFKNGPTISYGKRKNLASGIVEDYLILPDTTKGFNSDEKNNFEKICKSFSWTSTSNPGEILPPCYGFFAFGDGSTILVARFIDDGRDNQGRADLLRVDAIKVPAQLFHELKSDLRLVFDSSIWNNIFAVENSMADSIVISSDDCDKVFELVKKNITVPLLVGCSKNFKFKPTSGKFNTFDINLKTVEEISVPVVAAPSNPRIPLPPPKSNSIVVVQKNLRIVFLLVVGISITIFWGANLKIDNQKLADEKSDLEKDKKELDKTNLILVVEKGELNKKHTDLVIKNKSLVKELEEKQNINVFELMKQLGDKPGMDHALKVLKDIRTDAFASFVKEIQGKFQTEFQKETSNFQKTILIWLDKQKIADPKSKSNNGK